MKNLITMPCDYQHPRGRACEEGQVLVYGEQPMPPEIIVCPKCGGAGKIKVKRSQIKAQIKGLEEEAELINREIAELQSYLQ